MGSADPEVTAADPDPAVFDGPTAGQYGGVLVCRRAR